MPGRAISSSVLPAPKIDAVVHRGFQGVFLLLFWAHHKLAYLNQANQRIFSLGNAHLS